MSCEECEKKKVFTDDNGVLGYCLDPSLKHIIAREMI